MRLLRLLLVFVLLVLCVAPLFADDVVQPPWPWYGPRTTYQRWTFDTLNPNPSADWMANYYGLPTCAVTPGPGMGWLSNWMGRTGVWQLSGNIITGIPNVPDGQYKNMWIQFTWFPQQVGQLPNVKELLSNETGNLVSQTMLENGWWHSIYSIRIYPNPVYEEIKIWGEINVDELAIHTQCVVPEPSSLLALSGGLLGLLGFARKRRN